MAVILAGRPDHPGGRPDARRLGDRDRDPGVRAGHRARTGREPDRDQAARDERRRVLQRELGAPVRERDPARQLPRDVRDPRIPAALTYTFGKMVGNMRQGWVLFAAMYILFVVGLVLDGARRAERHAARCRPPGSRRPPTTSRARRSAIGAEESALWAVATTDASNGSVNSMHDSYRRLAALAPMFNMAIGEVDLRRRRQRPLRDDLLRRHRRVHRRPDGRAYARVPRARRSARDRSSIVGHRRPRAVPGCPGVHRGGRRHPRPGSPARSTRAPRVQRDPLRVPVPGQQQRLGVRRHHREQPFYTIAGGIAMLVARFVPLHRRARARGQRRTGEDRAVHRGHAPHRHAAVRRAADLRHRRHRRPDVPPRPGARTDRGAPDARCSSDVRSSTPPQVEHSPARVRGRCSTHPIVKRAVWTACASSTRHAAQEPGDLRRRGRLGRRDDPRGGDIVDGGPIAFDTRDRASACGSRSCSRTSPRPWRRAGGRRRPTPCGDPRQTSSPIGWGATAPRRPSPPPNLQQGRPRDGRGRRAHPGRRRDRRGHRLGGRVGDHRRVRPRDPRVRRRPIGRDRRHEGALGLDQGRDHGRARALVHRPDDRARRRSLPPEDPERDRALDPPRQVHDHLPDRLRRAAAVRDLLGRARVRRRPDRAVRLPHPHDDRRPALRDRHRGHGPSRAAQRPRDERPSRRSGWRRADAPARQDGDHHAGQPAGGRSHPGARGRRARARRGGPARLARRRDARRTLDRRAREGQVRAAGARPPRDPRAVRPVHGADADERRRYRWHGDPQGCRGCRRGVVRARAPAELAEEVERIATCGWDAPPRREGSRPAGCDRAERRDQAGAGRTLRPAASDGDPHRDDHGRQRAHRRRDRAGVRRRRLPRGGDARGEDGSHQARSRRAASSSP